MKREKGFTIIEMAMVMVVVGLALLLASKFYMPRIQAAKQTEMRSEFDHTVDLVLTDVKLSGGVIPPLLANNALVIEERMAHYVPISGIPYHYVTKNFFDGGADAVSVCYERVWQYRNFIEVKECKNEDCSDFKLTQDVGFVMFFEGLDGTLDIKVEDGDNITYIDDSGTTRDSNIKHRIVTIPMKGTRDVVTKVNNSDVTVRRTFDDIAVFYTMDQLRVIANCPRPQIIPDTIRGLPIDRQTGFTTDNYTFTVSTDTDETVFWCVESDINSLAVQSDWIYTQNTTPQEYQNLKVMNFGQCVTNIPYHPTQDNQSISRANKLRITIPTGTEISRANAGGLSNTFKVFISDNLTHTPPGFYANMSNSDALSEQRFIIK